MYASADRRRIGIGLLAGLLLLGATAARAGGLGVSPIVLDFDAKSPARALWLSNAGDHTLHGQLRVFRWTQINGEDHLEATRDLVLSPPMLELAAGDQQLVRVIRTAPYPAGEQAYRILVNELPDASADAHSGLSFVMEFSVPVFVGSGAPPQLSWSLRAEAGQAVLDARNAGGMRAQIADVELFDARGTRLTQQAGLFGYVLAGQQRRWTLAPDAAGAQTLQANLNGERIRVDLRAPGAAP